MKLMRYLLTVLLVFSSPLIASEEIKETIAHTKKALFKATTDKQRGPLYYTLALAYLQDQEVELAFEHFLKALHSLPTQPLSPPLAEEAPLYEEALAFYLKNSAEDPTQTAQVLLEKYGEVGEAHLEYVHLNFLLATAYANQGEYALFFDRFYRGFPTLHATHLSYKTQGVLFLRLAGHESSLEKRQSLRVKATELLTQALALEGRDANLYKTLLFLAREEKNETLIQSYLQTMVANGTVPARADLYAYVCAAVNSGAGDLAKQMIDQAREVYHYSRAITAAEEYLQKHYVESRDANRHSR